MSVYRIVGLFLTIVFSGQASIADADIRSLRRQYVSAAERFNRAYQDLGIGQVVLKSRYDFTEIVDEVITSEDTDVKKVAGSFRFFGEYLFGYEEWNTEITSKLVTRNQSDVVLTEGRVAANLDQLRIDLLDYMERHIYSIASMKVDAAMAFQVAAQLAELGQPVSMKELKLISERTTEIEFGGRQDVSICVQVNHKKAQESSGETYGLNFPWLKLDFTPRKNHVTYHEYTSETCDATFSSIRVFQNQSVHRIVIQRIDDLINEWEEVAYLSLAAADSQGIFEDWGSPFYTDEPEAKGSLK